MPTKHILIVDDEAQIRAILSQVLLNHGYRVSEAESVAGAMETTRRDRPDLIISDLQLEESDGFDFIDQVKQIAPEIPVILLTGVLFDADVIRRLGQEKIAAYIEKTAPLERILSEVRKNLGER